MKNAYKPSDIQDLLIEDNRFTREYKLKDKYLDENSKLLTVTINFSYPVPFCHFRRLRWPGVNKLGFYTIEEVGRDFLESNNIAKGKLERFNYSEWNYLLSIRIRGSYQKVSGNVLFSKWKTKNRKEFNKLKRLFLELELKGIPDFVEYDNKSNRLTFWEIKAPFDQITKQKVFFNKVNNSFETVQCKILSFEFLDKTLKKELNNYRKSYRQSIVGEVANFSSSSTGKKIVKMANEHFVNSYRARSQTYLLKYNPIEIFYSINKEGEAKLNKEQEVVADKFLNSGYEILSLLYSHKDKIKFTQNDIIQTTIHLFKLGYYKWWLTPFIFNKVVIDKKLNKSLLFLISRCILFEKTVCTVLSIRNSNYLKQVFISIKNNEPLKKNRKLLKEINDYLVSYLTTWT